MNVYYSKSADGVTWDKLTPIIFPSKDKHQFDGKGLYKSALLKENGQYYVFIVELALMTLVESVFLMEKILLI